MDRASLGSTKKGHKITFPPGIEDLSMWGNMFVEFGKRSGKELAFEDLTISTEKEHKRYVKWCIGQVDAAEGRLSDLSLYLVAREHVMGSMEQRPVIPGTTEVRRLRRQ